MKKLLSLILAAMIALGAFSLAACNSDGAKDQPSGGSTQPKDPPKTEPEKGDDGDTAEDAASLKQSLVERVLATVMECGKCEISLHDVVCTMGDKRAAGDYSVETHFRYADAELCADAFVTQGEGAFALGFLRGDTVCYGTDTWQNVGVAAGEFGELLAAYKGENGPALTRYTSEKGAITMPVSLAVKLAMNLPELTGGMILSETSDGYEMTYDPMGALSMILNELNILMGTVATPQMTVEELLSNQYMDVAFSTLFRGVTAREVTALPFLADYKSMFPDGGDKEFYPYFREIVASESYYAELPMKNRFEGVTRLGDLTLENVLSLTPLTDGEDGEKLQGEALTAKVDALLKEFGGFLNSLNIDPVGAAIDYLYAWFTGETPYCSGEAKMTFSLRFDREKELTAVLLHVTEFDEVSRDGSVTLSGRAEIRLTFDDTYAFADLSDVNTVEAN